MIIIVCKTEVNLSLSSKHIPQIRHVLFKESYCIQSSSSRLVFGKDASLFYSTRPRAPTARDCNRECELPGQAKQNSTTASDGAKYTFLKASLRQVGSNYLFIN